MISVESCGFIFLKEKSEALVCFKSFKTFTENQSGYKIKTLRSDRGGEYIAFGNFLTFITSKDWDNTIPFSLLIRD